MQLLKKLDTIISDLVEFYHKKYDYNIVIYTDWTGKDVLAHITSWHESFAKNTFDVVNKIKPNPLKGSLTDVNERGVFEKKEYSINKLLCKLLDAHRIIQDNILNDSIILIPYKKGSRDYSAEEHLEVVAKHIASHLEDLKVLCKQFRNNCY